MIEYGLSVSLEGTPNKTPMTPRGGGDGGSGGGGGDSQEEYGCDAPDRRRRCARKLTFGDLVMMMARDDAGDGEENVDKYESISPRVCYSETVRRLDFSMESSELLPVPFSSVSAPRNNCADADAGAGAGADVCSTALLQEQQCIIGECAVCYQNLIQKHNHVYTLCGHLFCVKCVLKWWDTSFTCPICRAPLLNVEEDEENDDHHGDYDPAAELDNAVLALEIEIREYDDEAWMQPPPEFLAAGEGHNDINNPNPNPNPNPRQEPYLQNVTSLNRYIYQDTHFLWSVIVTDETDPNYDDTVYQLSNDEIRGLRENREIAMTLFARMRFRETLFQFNRQFLGSVWSGEWVHVLNWVDIVDEYQRNLSSIQTVMYEFVIRRGSDISPTNEVSIFGFIKDVTMQEIDHVDNYGGADHWENTVEYAFVADVFTPTDFYIQDLWGNPNLIRSFRSYGSYDMTDGTIHTQELVITFSQVRRLYRINGWESCEA